MRNDSGSQQEDSALLPALQIREHLLAVESQLLQEASHAADRAAQINIFERRQSRKAWNTVRAEIAALTTFMTYLAEAGIILSFHLAEEPRLWTGITFGLVEGFLLWEELQGYAPKTRNDHLSIIKLYTKLAYQAGVMTTSQRLKITDIPRIRAEEAARMEMQRLAAGLAVRRGSKKSEATFLSSEEFQLLLARPATAQGQRDLVAILLMYDLSLRPIEVVSLRLADLDLTEKKLYVNRTKTSFDQFLRPTQRLEEALQRYLAYRQDLSRQAPLIIRSRKSGELVELIDPEAPQQARRGGRAPRSQILQAAKKKRLSAIQQSAALITPSMSTQALRERIHEIGLEISMALYGDDRLNLTSYDGRHEFTRSAIRAGTDPITVTKAGGWRGRSAMVQRYYGELQIANQDVKLKR